MKRSEMIEKCFEDYKQNYENNVPVVITPYVIEHVLEIAELYGMLPPNSWTKESKDKYVSEEMGYDSYLDYCLEVGVVPDEDLMFYSWEPEEEDDSPSAESVEKATTEEEH